MYLSTPWPYSVGLYVPDAARLNGGRLFAGYWLGSGRCWPVITTEAEDIPMKITYTRLTEWRVAILTELAGTL